MANYIYPIHHETLSKIDKEILLKQKAIAVWMIGLSGSGKSTLAKALEKVLHDQGYLTMLLDGDNLRGGINNNLGFSEEDRIENIRRAAETARLFVQCGIVTICSFISPTEKIREMAKRIIGEDCLEIYINAPLEICEERDVKGLYKKARKGELKNFTGIDSPFEAPTQPDLEIHTDLNSKDECLEMLVKFVLERVEKV
ncbi:MAG: adenylyl-sulfate kinase [Opitutaceae bacterium]|nr:adenylyl-sulfate kinase [Cytophagales bacterium]